jgi:hypothetical protein
VKEVVLKEAVLTTVVLKKVNQEARVVATLENQQVKEEDLKEVALTTVVLKRENPERKGQEVSKNLHLKVGLRKQALLKVLSKNQLPEDSKRAVSEEVKETLKNSSFYAVDFL